eukprot:gnl/TRDRNA2_/TRDRNA2_133096_c0_seq2.p1 gnl/TRDRNA2_/TRDRNA2_133096_c0~~gnl/TRDRNA2_/TRDRNA2_133096_c0_seq2.p1  ORF type:complete len:118 (+),score=16.71 gnl/TRDRNA2_/TRDRNA2_133096_c0_seq2:13-366(+)
MLPFPHDIDYRAFVVEVPQREVERGRFVDALLRISDDELEARRQAMRRARHGIRFDFQGSAPDTFSLTVKSVWKFLESQRARPGFDCGVPPLLEPEGTMMYGHFACCPLSDGPPPGA